MKKELPLYKMQVVDDDNSEEQVKYIALVDAPAIEINWMAFNKHFKFQADTDRRILTGPFMVADMPIYRIDARMASEENPKGEFYVVFDKNEIMKIVQKFFRKGFVKNFNIMHNPNDVVNGCYIIESMIIDSSRGITPPEAFKGISEGSWLGSIKVDDDKLWEEYIKTGVLNGFSVEGVFDMEYVDTEMQNVLESIAEVSKGE